MDSKWSEEDIDLAFNEWKRIISKMSKCTNSAGSGGPGYISYSDHCKIHKDVRYGCSFCPDYCRDFCQKTESQLYDLFCKSNDDIEYLLPRYRQMELLVDDIIASRLRRIEEYELQNDNFEINREQEVIKKLNKIKEYIHDRQ